MELYEYSFCLIFFIQVLNFITGQLIPQEELKNITSCDFPINLTCESNEIIAVHSLYFWYHATCSGTCCNYNSSHFSAGADTGVIQAVRRKCSGENACSLVHLDGKRDFGSGGVHDPSYFVVKYYCIPASRTTSICSGETLTSAGEPVYLINDNCPSVTTGNSTCSCSLEVFSCMSSVNLYILDADLYLDAATCEQTIDFVDGTSTSLSTINCKSYYENRIDEISFSTNYVKIDLIDNSVQNQEGYILLGFGVSEKVSFKLSCPYEQQTVCRDCGSIARLDNGQITLASENVTSVGAIANVACDIGYNASTFSIRCQSSGLWDTVRCTIIDCGNPYQIEYGSVTLLKTSTTMYSSLARVTCQEGYKTRKQVITCKETGAWEISSCEPEDDDRLTLFVLVAILSTLLMVVTILFGFYVFWRYRKRQRKRGSSKEVNTYEEVYRQSQQPQYSDIALETTRVDE